MEWKYLFYTLEKLDFGDNFISWVRSLYSASQASVRTNNSRSDYFPSTAVHSSGMSLESTPLRHRYRTPCYCTEGWFNYKRYKKNGYRAKSVFVCGWSPPLYFWFSLPAALNILKSFGIISGYKLNLSKSEISGNTLEYCILLTA